MTRPRSHAELLRSARLALGVAVICLLFAIETIVAHHVKPNPASVWVWALLGGAGTAALARFLWLRRLCQRAPDRPGRG